MIVRYELALDSQWGFFTKIPSLLDFMRAKILRVNVIYCFDFGVLQCYMYSYSFWNNDNYDAVHFLKKPVFPLFFLLDLCFYLSFFGMCQKIGVKSLKNLLKRGKGYKKMFSFSTSFAHFRQIFNFGDHLFKTKLNSNFGFLIPRLWGRGNH